MSVFDTFLNLDVLVRSLPLLLSGLNITFSLGILSIILGFSGGMLVALTRLYAAWPLRVVCVAFIDVFRAIPILVLLSVVYYAVPFITPKLQMSAFQAALISLSLVCAAYSAEIFRAGIEAVAKGQFEAAHALSLGRFRTLTDVVLPQAIRMVIPPLTSSGINVIKDTALASVVALPDLLKQAVQMQALYANPTPLIGAAGIYLLFLLPMVRLVALLEKRLARGHR